MQCCVEGLIGRGGGWYGAEIVREIILLFLFLFEGDRDCNMEMLSDVGKVEWIRLDTSAAVEGATSDRMPAG